MSSSVSLDVMAIRDLPAPVGKHCPLVQGNLPRITQSLFKARIFSNIRLNN
jgi:hypothetical protein